MDYAEARRIAQSVVDAKQAASRAALALTKDGGERIDQGWVFYWNSRAYVETGNLRKLLLGPGPLIVLDDGRVVEDGSGGTPISALYRNGIIVPQQFEVLVSWDRSKATRRLIGGGEFEVGVRRAGGPEDIPLLLATVRRTDQKDLWWLLFCEDLDPRQWPEDGADLVLLEWQKRVASAKVIRRRDVGT